jgi:hypothetical protein
MIRSDLPPAVAPGGDFLVRLVAGYFVLVLAAAVALVVTAVLQTPMKQAWPRATWLPDVGFFVILFCYAFFLAWFGPLYGNRFFRWVIVAVTVGVALFVAAPVGILVIVLFVSGLGGLYLARVEPPRGFAGFLSSPLPWMVVLVYTLVGLAAVVDPPVYFQETRISMSAEQLAGGYVTRTSDGVYLVTCRASRTGSGNVSTQEHVTLIPSAEIRRVVLTGRRYIVDDGTRRSLASLLLGFGGLTDAPLAISTVGERSRRHRVCGS